MEDNLKDFMVKNRAIKEPTKYPASEVFIDKEGKAKEWVLKPILPEENDRLLSEAMVPDIDLQGNPVMKFRESEYRKNLMVESVIFPNLNDAELQNFYNVMEPGALLNAMLNIKEYKLLFDEIQEVNGFKVNIDKKVDEAKN